ncbi:MAG: hypothetical protein WC477_07300 [Patescibacteria group bacterium]
MTTRLYYEKNKEKILRDTKAYQKAHPLESAKWNRNNQRRRRLERKKRIVKIFGNKCQKCGFEDWRALQVDHINGGGLKEVKSFKHRDNYYASLEKEVLSGKYQLLCANCNWIKRYEEKEGRLYI